MDTQPLAPIHRQHSFVFVFAICLIVAGTTIWILNILGIVPGPWSNVLSALSTGGGLVAALLQGRQSS